MKRSRSRDTIMGAPWATRMMFGGIEINGQRRLRSPSDPMLTDKTIYRDQSFAHGIDGDEKTFEGDGAKQSRSIGCNEAWGGDFIAVESQLCFGDGPCISLSSSDDHSLRTRGFQFEFIRQGLWHDAQSRAGIDKELNFFDAPGRPGQMSLDVKNSHLIYLFKNKDIVSLSIGNAIARNEA